MMAAHFIVYTKGFYGPLSKWLGYTIYFKFDMPEKYFKMVVVVVSFCVYSSAS